jgi:hypothetical protein
MERGKRLSRSNVIGRQGEIAFEAWALDHHLSPNKAGTDLGVDFFCQVMAPLAGSKSIEGAGHVLGAQVKTVGDEEKPRLRLDRIDATDLLRQTQATCLFGLRLSDTNVRFQFLTKEFMDRLLDFLDTDHEHLSIAYTDMSDDANLFSRLLRKYVNPFEQLQLRIHLIRRRVTRAIPGSAVEVASSEGETVFQAYVPSVSSALMVAPSAREQLRLKVLRGGNIEPGKDDVELHPAILDALVETRSSRLELASVRPEKVKLGIRWEDNQAMEQFERHTYETEVAFVHRAGLRLTWNTKPERAPEGLVHTMESEIFRPAARSGLSGSVLKFLQLFRPGAVLSLPGNWELPLSSFGPSLEQIGQAVDPIPDLCNALGFSLSRVLLSDIEDEEFARSTRLLEALLLKDVSVGEWANSFIVGPAADLPIEQVPTVPIALSVPLVLNWKDMGIVIRLECDGDGFLHEGLLCGIRLKQQNSWKIEKTKRYNKSVYPELWIAKDWPPLPIGTGSMGVRDWTFDPARAPSLDAVIKKQND